MLGAGCCSTTTLVAQIRWIITSDSNFFVVKMFSYKYPQENALAFHLIPQKKIKMNKKKIFSEEIIKSAHDISDGGLSVNLAESICIGKEGVGADVSVSRKLREDQILFGETQGVIIVTVNPKDLHHVALISQGCNVYTQTIGTVTDSARLKINNSI